MMHRRTILLLPFAAAACSSSAPPRVFDPLHYDYLDPLSLDVGVIDIDDHWRATSPNDVGDQSPARPVPSLVTMARDRLKPGGAAGRAVFTITSASVIKTDDSLVGNFGTRVDIYDAGNTRVGYAEARVGRTRTGLGSRAEFTGLLYDFVKAMTDAMNVELEFQVRHALKDLLATGANAPALPAPVMQQTLAPPKR